MAITKKKPATKLTVGAQYICFCEMGTDGEWSDEYEEEVIKLPTVVDVDVADDLDSYDSYASGDVYEADALVNSVTIGVTNLAFPDSLMERMRGNTMDDGVVVGGGIVVRPYFAYGIVVEKKDGSLDMRWYPKCKLTENSDATSTKTDSHSDQTDTVSIKAYGYNAAQQKYVRVLTAEEGMSAVTEDKFFAAPILTAAAAKALKGNG